MVYNMSWTLLIRKFNVHNDLWDLYTSPPLPLFSRCRHSSIVQKQLCPAQVFNYVCVYIHWSSSLHWTLSVRTVVLWRKTFSVAISIPKSMSVLLDDGYLKWFVDLVFELNHCLEPLLGLRRNYFKLGAESPLWHICYTTCYTLLWFRSSEKCNKVE